MSGLWAHLSSIRWQDVVDILINSYILFRLYVLFRNTNAFRILVGIASLWIIQEMAASIGLILTSWALQGITAAAAVIIVVVFRNEIRSALQVRNLRTFLWGAPAAEAATPLEVIAEAVHQMGRKRIGALLVFPGKEDLREVVHGGLRWDGAVSQEMIISIFWPQNPVHDGAILIQGDRIVEVGVLLPLSQRKDLPTYYGTRHRAAAGLAERSDALVVVVSEERGRITVAKDQWIKPITQTDELIHLLRRQFDAVEPVDGGERRRDQWQLVTAAVLSFLIMTGVWFGFTRSRNTIIALDAPIEFVSRPTNFEILKTSVNQVHLQLNGSAALIKSLRSEQVSVQVDLSRSATGINKLPITQSQIRLPPGVFLSKVDPELVEVTLDAPETRELPVQVDWTGHLEDGLVLTQVTVKPEKVKILGGRTTLDGIDTIYTVPVKLDGLKASNTLEAPLLITPASLKLVEGSPERVTIRTTIVKREVKDKNPQ